MASCDSILRIELTNSIMPSTSELFDFGLAISLNDYVISYII